MRKNNTIKKFKNRAFIYSDGSDELQYFQKLAQIYRGKNSRYKLEVTNKEGKSKIDLIKDIVTDKIENHRDHDVYDIFCAVTDYDFVDGGNTHNKSIHGRNLAEENKIEYYLSNDSWELWILLHFEDVTLTLSRKELNKRLKDKYYYDKEDKKSRDNFIYNTITKNLVSNSVTRAKTLHKRQGHDDFKNPSTNVYKLVEKLFSL